MSTENPSSLPVSTIEKIVYPGKALGKVQNEGIIAFIDGALPGETVEVEVMRRKKKYIEGKALNILTPSPERIVPKCPSFGICGGCSLQHTGYENQLKIKQLYVEELLKPVISLYVEPIIESPEIWEYRNKMEFSFGKNETTPLFIGLHQRGAFDRHFRIPPCFIADRDFLWVMEQVENFAKKSGLAVYDKRTHEGFFRHLVIKKAKRKNQIMINLVTNSDPHIKKDFFRDLINTLKLKVHSFFWTVNGKISDTVQADELHLLYGEPIIEEELIIHGQSFFFHIGPFSFFQTNTYGAEKLYEHTMNLLEPKSNETLLDLYCGTGTIGIIAARSMRQVFGVEVIEDAIENAKINKKLNEIYNIDFQSGSVEKWMKHAGAGSWDNIIIDPPRGGLTPKVIDFLVKSKAKKVVYVSCNPSTLARDLQDLLSKSNYKIKKIQPVDMFPQTYHVEVIVQLILE